MTKTEILIAATKLAEAVLSTEKGQAYSSFRSTEDLIRGYADAIKNVAESMGVDTGGPYPHH